ncbi:MAG: hypothetical protein EPN74_02185 [Rhodanobacter sp.]|nr:MAG: hypothetical protein EPN74_02185 [Rhodanobacter sp.]
MQGGQPEGWRWGLAVMLLLAGCAAQEHRPLPKAQGEASWKQVTKPGTVRYSLALGQVASGAAPFQRVAPIYPPSQLASCPTRVEVQGLLIVDARGHVSAVRVADASAADPAGRTFIDAVRTAARQWRFTPLHIDQWAADASGNSHLVDRETRPFSLSYRFRFTCRAGHATVSTRSAGGGQ